MLNYINLPIWKLRLRSRRQLRRGNPGFESLNHIKLAVLVHSHNLSMRQQYQEFKAIFSNLGHLRMA